MVEPTTGTAAASGAALRFQAGGTVREASIYVPRAADEELFRIMERSEFCYVLAPRQIGKSSLRVRAERRLAAGAVTVISIDLTAIGTSGVSPDAWLYSLCSLITDEAALDLDLEAFWVEGARLSPIQRWSRFLHKELLGKVPGKIAVFIDEIDAVFGLAFSTDDFFASIRELYNARAGDRACERITFCLIGLATPSNLMKDAARTPFNIGRAVPVDDFTRDEASALLPGLAETSSDAEALLHAVYGWTSGHPYMTQRVCDRLVHDEAREGEDTTAKVDRVVGEVFLSRGRIEDANLMYAERYLAKRNSSAPVTAMLFLYREILEGKAIASDPNSAVEAHLRLSGLAAPRAAGEGEPRRLALRNRIFGEVFGLPWVSERERELLSGELLQRWLSASPESRKDFVLRGSALEDALSVALTRKDVSAQEEAFLLASQEVARKDEELRREAEQKASTLDRERRERAEEQQRRAEEQQREAEQKAAISRRNAVWLGAFSALLLLMLAVSTYLFQDARTARQSAESARIEAEKATRIAEDAQREMNKSLSSARDAVLIERGERAKLTAAQPGRETEALVLGIQAVGQRDADPDSTPPATVEGLVRGLMPARLLSTLEGHTRSVVEVAFSPARAEKKWLLTASSDSTAKLWPLDESGPPLTLACPDGHTDELRAAIFSPDGKQIATASNDRTAKIWSVNGQLLVTLQGHGEAVTSVVFSPDGTRVLTASNDKT
ncbi:MAG: AAA-like domain-containing protein, partial [Minicystis sp.]